MAKYVVDRWILAAESTGMILVEEKIDPRGLISVNKANLLLYKY